ncbi:MAG: cupin domain-containing protein, partial [Pikeienuella sp.]
LPAIAAAKAAKVDLDFTRLDADKFARAEDISVDYAVFEKTDKGAVVPTDIQWSDLGAWKSIWDASDKDKDGNAIIGSGLMCNASNCFVATEGPHISVQNLDDVAVVATQDAVWVGRLSKSEDIKTLVAHLKANPATLGLTNHHRTNYRPWGGYTSILDGDRFQVKRLFVKPGAKLSLQKHHHRAEHWVVVRGSAEVTIDGRVFLLAENQSTYIPLGATHRLANPGMITLELVEVQSGSYLGEDDIIRIEDEFGRS